MSGGGVVHTYNYECGGVVGVDTYVHECGWNECMYNIQLILL